MCKVPRTNRYPVVCNGPIQTSSEITVSNIEELIASERATRFHTVPEEDVNDRACDFIIRRDVGRKRLVRQRHIIGRKIPIRIAFSLRHNTSRSPLVGQAPLLCIVPYNALRCAVEEFGLGYPQWRSVAASR
jgi:hypothetical protein